jgi:ubiquinone/menaquinone biosynthesis C-methylase UbiE
MEASGCDGRIGRYGGALADALIRVDGVSRDDEVLDVGCGTGALTERLAMFVRAARVTTVDPSPASVGTCAARVPGATIRVGWAEDLPFADHAFDAVLAQLVFAFVSDGELAAGEMRRTATRRSSSHMRLGLRIRHDHFPRFLGRGP